MTETHHTAVLDVPERSRFEIRVEGALAGIAAYRVVPGAVRFIHTEIDDAYAGRGLGGTLVRGALNAVRARRLAVLPECPFVRGWIAKHPEYVDLVPEAERARFGL
jgi:predicted GNAT family acetyltransferase